MSSERLIAKDVLQSEALVMARSHSIRPCGEAKWIFDELPKATIESVSRPDTSDISPMRLSYTIDIQYKQFKWRLVKKASQVLYLHFALKKRAFIEELQEKQEQLKEWLPSLGIFDHTAVVQDDDEPDDGYIPVHHEESVRKRYVPSRAALPIIRPALGGQQSIADSAKVAMQGYLNHFLGNMDIVNSREVCKFLEVSRFSFSREYGSKLKEGYLLVKDLPRDDSDVNCCVLQLTGCCQGNWNKVWAVLKPGFLAFLDDPFDTQLLDIIVFDVIPASAGNGASQQNLANQMKERNPLRYAFRVTCGNRTIKLRTSSTAKVRDWIAEINNAGLGPQEGWCHAHRFGSFAPQRGLAEDGSQAQWFIDGQAAFGAIASSIEKAKSEIFLTGWWICPEMFLKRPFDCHPSSRLDALLEQKAKQGVQIYILLYKEVSLALKINSMYSKKRLLNIHENVRVLRYPDHISTGIYYWSHHEKLVIVDYQICFIGGLDLCFGRYDTTEHKVGDYPPAIWPGKDYYNPRESEPNSWEDTMIDELNRKKYPRMPWHDVHCALWGPPCRDIARHFVQRWNHAKRNKAPNEQKFPLLVPRHHMVLPHYMGRSKEIDIKDKDSGDNQKGISRQDSFSSQSPLQDIPLLLPQEADGLAASNGHSKLNSLHINHNLLDQPTEVCESFAFSFQKPEIEDSVLDTQPNGFTDELDFMDLQIEEDSVALAQCGTKALDKCIETPKEGAHDAVADDCVGPRSACGIQVIRSVSQWSAGTSQPEASIQSAYCSLIEKAQHFIYIENQFFVSGLEGDEIIQNRVLEALYKRIVKAHKEQKCFRVVVVLPLLPGFQGGVDDGGAATVRALMHWQYRTISREKHSILHKLDVSLGPKTSDYISFYGLRSYGELFNGGPVATSQVYVHSKLMLIDDHISLIGSSNINDRSLLGSRDSEIGVVIEDKEFLDSTMNGEPWQAGKFAYSLRCSLWSEHLGISPGEINQIRDPVADSTYKDLWLATAKENSIIYQDVFACIPNDRIHSRAALRQSMAHWKEKLGHTTIDLGIAPEKLESYENGERKVIDPMKRLMSTRGHLVSFPLEFMCEENNLKPMFNETEFYAAPHVFH